MTLPKATLSVIRWISDATLPRDGTDLIATGIREVDQRPDATSVTVLTSSPLGCVRWIIDPMLPRDLMTPGVVMRIVDVHNPFEYESLLAGLVATLAPALDHLWQQ
jgi:hypothetical protein